MNGTAGFRYVTRDPVEFSLPNEREWVASRIFRTSPHRLFDLFTDPASVAYVWAPAASRVTVREMDVRPGGRYAFELEGRDGETIRFFGEFREVTRPFRVVNTFEASVLPGVVAVETDLFERIGEFTRLTVRWRYDRREDRDKMAGPESEKGLTTLLDRLAELVGPRRT